MAIHRDLCAISGAEKHNERGICLADRGWLIEAKNEFEKALSIEPNNSASHDNLGTIFAEQGDILSALFSYLRAIDADPNNAWALHNLACLLSDKANDLSIICFKRAIKNSGDFFEAHYNLALHYFEHNEFKKCIDYLLLAISIKGDHIDAHLKLALCYIEMNETQKALCELYFVTRNDNKNDYAWYLLGTCLVIKNFLINAEEAFYQALKLNNQNIEAALELFMIHVKEGRKKEAKNILQRCKKINFIATKEFIESKEDLAHYLKL